jgi:hypothetical protein
MKATLHQIQSPSFHEFLQWSLSNCPGCKELGAPYNRVNWPTNCQDLNSITFSIIEGLSINVESLKRIDHQWRKPPQDKKYQLPPTCDAFEAK